MGGSPFTNPDTLPGTYTFTLKRGTEVQTSRPYTLDYLPNQRPAITRQPVGVAVRAGEAVMFNVEVQSATPVTYRWLRDGSFFGDEGSELRIPAVAQVHTGEHTVEVRNAAGVVWSEPARLGRADVVTPVFRGSESVAANDDWERQLEPARVAAAAASAGAFALRSGSADAALLVDLPPGSYTVQVAGARDTTGLALVEVYEVK